MEYSTLYRHDCLTSENPHKNTWHKDDFENFHELQARLQSLHPNDWGIVDGLNVNLTIEEEEDNAKITIYPGIAIDGSGHLICMAEEGIKNCFDGTVHEVETLKTSVEINVREESYYDAYSSRFEFAPFDITKESVSAIPDGYIAVLVISWFECNKVLRDTHSPQSVTYLGYQRIQSVWVQLKEYTLDPNRSDEDEEIKKIEQDNNYVILATIRKNEDSTLVLSTDRRRVIGQSVKELTIRRSSKGAVSGGDSPETQFVSDNTAGVIGPADNGGLKISVPNRTATISIVRKEPLTEREGNFEKLKIRADNLHIQNAEGANTIRIDSQDAKLYLGGQGGKDGDLFVYNNAGECTFNIDGHEGDFFVRRKVAGQEREVLKFDASGARLNLGNRDNPGDLSVRNEANIESVRIYGEGGDIKLRGQLLDGRERNIGLDYDQKESLTNDDICNLHKHGIGDFGNEHTVTKVGIISGHVRLSSEGVEADYLRGKVRLNFSDHSFDPDPGGSGFLSSNIQGFQGTFEDPPHVILSPYRLVLSTWEDTLFNIQYSKTNSNITISWVIDFPSGSWHQIDFLIIGAI